MSRGVRGVSWLFPEAGLGWVLWLEHEVIWRLTMAGGGGPSENDQRVVPADLFPGVLGLSLLSGKGHVLSHFLELSQERRAVPHPHNLYP